MGCDVLYIFRGGGHGGDAMMTLRLAAAVQARGYSVRVMVSSGELHADVFQETAEELGVPCDVVDYFAENGRWSRWKMFSNLAKYLLKCSPKVLHLHTGNAFVNPSLALALALLVRGRRIVTLHCPGAQRPDEERAWNYSQYLFHQFIFPSNHERIRQSKARPRLGRRAETIGNLVLPLPDLQPARCDVRRELGLNAELIVLYCARLDFIKRPDIAIGAFAEAMLDHPDATFVMAGDGELRESCKEAVAALGSRGRFLGFRKDVGRLLRAADVFILPTRMENLSLGILEAMAAGLPILSSDTPGVTEALGGTGIACAVDSQQSVSQAMKKILTDGPLRREMGHQAHAHFVTRFSPAVIADQHLQAYGLCDRDAVNAADAGTLGSDVTSLKSVEIA